MIIKKNFTSKESYFRILRNIFNSSKKIPIKPIIEWWYLDDVSLLPFPSFLRYKLKLSHGSSITRIAISLPRNRNPFPKPHSRPGTKTFPHLEDTQAMFPGCVGSLNHSSTPRLKWVRESTSSILWLCTSTWARNRTEVPSVTSSFLYRIWNRLLVPGASNESGNKFLNESSPIKSQLVKSLSACDLGIFRFLYEIVLWLREFSIFLTIN